MADNITLSTNIGSGSVLATDDIAGAHYQIVKLTYGALDAQTIAASGAGAVTAGVPRYTLASDDPAVALLGTIDTDTGVIAGDTTSIDGKITACNTGAVVISSGTVTDITNTVTVDGTGTFAVQADLGANNDVQGMVAEGAAVTGTSPFLMAGDDGTNVKNLAVDATGNLQVDIVADGAGLLTTTAHDAAFGTAGTADAQVRSVQGIASMTPLLVDATGQGDVPITLAGEAVVLGAGTAGIGKLTANDGVDIGDVDVTSISAGSNLVGDVGLSGARTSGGTTIFRSIDVDETEDEVKATGGQVYWLHAMNLTASTLYLKVYNAAAAAVTVGTTTPVMTLPLATQGDTNGAGFTLSIPNGIAFSTGICVAATTGIADNDTGAPAANACVVNIGYA